MHPVIVVEGYDVSGHNTVSISAYCGDHALSAELAEQIVNPWDVTDSKSALQNLMEVAGLGHFRNP